MKHIKLLTILLFACTLHVRAQKPVVVQVDATQIENRIDQKVYGILLEHLFHSVSNGLWGEEVWNRSFEELLAYGNWQVNNKGEVTLDALGQSMADFRICRGRDYEVCMDVMRVEGDGPILIGVRDQNRERMLTNRIYCYLGAAQNSKHLLELHTGWIWHTPVTQMQVTDEQSGKLEVGVWNKVRIRCEGNHISGWLNGKQLFDRDVEQCPKDGAVTLGGEKCRAAFRNISVKALDNTSVNVNLNPVRHWNLVGEGTVETTQTGVLNHNNALHIHATGKLVGIEQSHNYSIRKDDALKGSLFLRGSADKVVVQILDGEKVLKEQYIKGIEANWKEFQVELPCKKDVPWATLRIAVQGKGDLYVDQVSLMHQSSIDNDGFRPALAEAAAALRPTILRWPGGSFSEQYRFENGIGKQSERKGILRWDDFDPLSFGTDEFITFCRRIGAEPNIVIPIGYHNYAKYAPDKDGTEDWLQRALDWMDYCNGDTTTTWGKRRAANGHPEPYNVKYWEIDNEVWKMDPNLYAELTRIFSIAMKKRYPDVKIIGCGCGRLGREGEGLDSIMIHGVAEYIDYISPHYYQTLNKYGTDGVEEYGRYLDKLASWIETSKNPYMKIYVSEWNLEGIDMRTGLFAGGFLNRLERTPKVEMAAPALFLRHTSATEWNNAFINFNQNGWFPAPNYVVFKLWREHYLPNRITLKGETGALNIVATASDDKKRVCLKMVNPTGSAIPMTVKEGIRLGDPVWEVVCSSSLTEANSMEAPNRIKAERRVATIENGDVRMVVPPYSASVLTFTRPASEMR